MLRSKFQSDEKCNNDYVVLVPTGCILHLGTVPTLTSLFVPLGSKLNPNLGVDPHHHHPS